MTVLADIPNPVGVVTGLFSSAAGWAFDKVAEGIAKWVLGAVEFFVNGAIDFLRTSTRPDVTATWFAGPGSPYAAVRNLAGLLLCAFVFLGLLQGLLAGDATTMVRRVVGNLPGAIAGMVLATVVVAHLLELTDAMSDAVMADTNDQALHFLSGFSVAVTDTNSGFAAVVLGLVAVFAGLLLWIELIVRSALVYLLVAISPLGFAATLWPAARGVLRRTIELLLATILSKLAICIALAVGVAALSGAGSSGNGQSAASGAGASAGTLLVGTVLLGLAAFAPFIVLKLIPIAEAAVIAQGISRGPARAAQTGLSTAYSASMVTRLSGGGQRGTGGSAAPTFGGGDPATAATGARAGSSAGSTTAASAAGGAATAGAGVAHEAAKRAGKTVQSAADAAAQQNAHRRQSSADAPKGDHRD